LSGRPEEREYSAAGAAAIREETLSKISVRRCIPRENSVMPLRPNSAAAGLSIAVGLLAALLAALPVYAQAPLKKVKLAYGGPALDISQPWLELPGPLGYWRQEGLDVDVFAARGSLQAIQLLIAGQADVAQINSWPLVQAATNSGILIRDVMLNTVIDWLLVVPQDSSIRTMRDFKGKTIGTAGLAGMALLKSFVQRSDLDPRQGHCDSPDRRRADGRPGARKRYGARPILSGLGHCLARKHRPRVPQLS
jgi:hypothetical protein